MHPKFILQFCASINVLCCQHPMLNTNPSYIGISQVFQIFGHKPKIKKSKFSFSVYGSCLNSPRGELECTYRTSMPSVQQKSRCFTLDKSGRQCRNSSALLFVCSTQTGRVGLCLGPGTSQAWTWAVPMTKMTESIVLPQSFFPPVGRQTCRPWPSCCRNSWRPSTRRSSKEEAEKFQRRQYEKHLNTHL